ncbi:MAG TPA: NAD(P)-binding protein [Pseudonocardiaceae bacterium]
MRGHAVVVGAGMGGLLAARALAGEYERVTVLERDPLPDGAERRRGVPQGRHFHALLRRGALVLEAMFPGLTGELAAAGAPTVDLLPDATFVVGGRQFVRARTGATMMQLTRPLLEGAVRRRVAALPGVRLVDRCAVTGPLTDRGRVVGVCTGERTLPADLVVDASGRGGRATAWLSALGHRLPAEERIVGDLVYVSRLVRLRTSPPPRGLTLVGPTPRRPTGFAFAAQENDHWMLTAVGMVGDHPPTDDPGLLAFLARCAPPDVLAAVAAAEPLTEPSAHRYPASVWRRYDRLRTFPEGLVVFGDAICGFNPIYGQGMTVAALEAEALRRLLRGRCPRTGDRDLARRFFGAAARIIEPVWLLNAVADLAIPGVGGRRTPATRALNRYIGRAQRAAEHDPVVATAFVRAIALLTPPAALLAPPVLGRVLLGGITERRNSAA